MASAARLTPSEGRWLRSLHQGVEEVTEAAQLAVHTYHTLVVAPGSRELRSWTYVQGAADDHDSEESSSDGARATPGDGPAPPRSATPRGE